MSGGKLTDYRHNLYELNRWADNIQPHNPMLAEQMRDLCHLLTQYDLFLSDDMDAERLQEEWTKYRHRWIDIGDDGLALKVLSICKEKVDELMLSVAKGDTLDGRDGE